MQLPCTRMCGCAKAHRGPLGGLALMASTSCSMKGRMARGCDPPLVQECTMRPQIGSDPPGHAMHTLRPTTASVNAEGPGCQHHARTGSTPVRHSPDWPACACSAGAAHCSELRRRMHLLLLRCGPLRWPEWWPPPDPRAPTAVALQTAPARTQPCLHHRGACSPLLSMARSLRLASCSCACAYPPTPGWLRKGDKWDVQRTIAQ